MVTETETDADFNEMVRKMTSSYRRPQCPVLAAAANMRSYGGCGCAISLRDSCDFFWAAPSKDCVTAIISLSPAKRNPAISAAEWL